jgi:site-specific DNA-methyltransferase (adenine-specific)
MLVQGNAVHNLPIADASIDMIFADPPYLKKWVYLYKVLADEAPRVLKQGGFVAAMCGGSYLNEIIQFFDDAGLKYYWLYTLAMGGKGSTCWRSNGSRNMPVGTPVKHVVVYSNGHAVSRTATTGYYKDNGKDKRYHEWGQGIDSHRYYIDCFTFPNDLVLDPFCGGGTTGAACEAIGRRYVLMDLDPDALEVTRDRLGVFAHQPADGGGE